MIRGPFLFCCLLKLLGVLQNFWPFLLAVLVEEVGVEGDATCYFCAGGGPVLVANLEEDIRKGGILRRSVRRGLVDSGGFASEGNWVHVGVVTGHEARECGTTRYL